MLGRWLRVVRYGSPGIALLAVLVAFAQTGGVAPPGTYWIWTDEGNPREQAPVGLRFFRTTFPVRRDPAEVKLFLVCDDAFVAYVNGQRVGSSRTWQSGSVFDVTNKVRLGTNTLAIEATNRGGPAGLAGWIFVRTKPGNHYVYPTNATWRWNIEPSEGWTEPEFDASKWKPVKVLGEFGKVAPWGVVTFGTQGRFSAPEGFSVELVADPDLTGSIVAFTFDVDGAPILSVERGPVIRLLDADGDGIFDDKQVVQDRVTNCQGLLVYDRSTYYFVGEQIQGRNVTTGLWRGRDRDADGRVDEVELLHRVRGRMAEHGPHAVIVGPDGYLYFNLGNHAWVDREPPSYSPVRTLYEGVLLPRFEDAHGHARGIRVPGGTIWRLDPDARDFTLETAGFRNEYDIAFSALGEVFTFDSDMEWDEGLPWYRPVRVCHCPPGAEFGWRSGCAKWPPYYIDSLPATIDIGRGSPTGVVFYHHRVYPEKYYDAFFIADWSYGRIFAIHLNRSGATFEAKSELFLLGKPLNVTDIEIGPDGYLYFTTGGRGTEGGLYRVVFGKPGTPGPSLDGVAAEDAVAVALRQPQPESAWGRERLRRLKEIAGEARWREQLLTTVRNTDLGAKVRIRALSYLLQFGPEPGVELARELAGDPDPELRGWAAQLIARYRPDDARNLLDRLVRDDVPIVQRRALEAYLRLELPAPVPRVTELLASDDRFVRFAAILTLERMDPVVWADAVLGGPKRASVLGVVALNRGGAVARSDDWCARAFGVCRRLLQESQDVEFELEVLRAIQLSLINSEERQRPQSTVDAIAATILERFPASDWRVSREYARLLAYLEPEGATQKLVAALESLGTEDQHDRAQAIHYVRCLVALETGWTSDLRDRVLRWFDVSRSWNGGHSYRGYLMNFLRDLLERVPREELIALIVDPDEKTVAATEFVNRLDQKNGAPFVEALGRALEHRKLPVQAVLAALGRVGRPEAERLILHHYRTHPEDRAAAIIALANYAKPAYKELFLQALERDDADVVRAALRGLRAAKPGGPDEYRKVLQAALRFGNPVGWAAVQTLRKWSGQEFGGDERRWRPELNKFLRWYEKTFPDGPPVQVATATYHEWTLEELLPKVEQLLAEADPERGKKVFEKATCAKCHRVGQFGTGIGPDLSTLGNRFTRKDILEAILQPSKTISDQYKTYTVLTTRGQIINGMRAPDEDGKIVLLLSDATTTKIPKDQVEEIVESSVSIMPEGLLNQLTPEEIADLVAFLEAAQVKGQAASSGSGGRD